MYINFLLCFFIIVYFIEYDEMNVNKGKVSQVGLDRDNS